jgi:hypothetical protein
VRPPDDAETAVFLIGGVERHQHVRQPLDVIAGVAPIRRVLVPTKARALARPLQVELVCPQCHALAAHDPAHGHHDALVVDQAVEDRVQVVEGLDVGEDGVASEEAISPVRLALLGA